MNHFILETKLLTKKYHNQIAVNGINMHVPQGKIYGLLGRNGAGKTTTLRMIMNLARQTSGDIFIFSKHVNGKEREIYRRIGSIIEMPGFYLNLTGRENLEILATLRGIHRHDAVDFALKRVGLDKETKKKVSQYSLGMKQRLGIASAIMHEPELLILDEPTNGLDPVGIQEMRRFLLSLCQEKGITILISSHILSEIEQLADVIGIIHDGVLLEEISIKELRRRKRQYIEFMVDDEKKAALILEKHLDIKDYEVSENKLIRIYSNIGQQAMINQVFVENGIMVSKLLINEEKLEDYFVKLIGGGDIG